jgi:hypothetical protein
MNEEGTMIASGCSHELCRSAKKVRCQAIFDFFPGLQQL